MHDLVVRERHDESLAVLVEHRERQLVVMEPSVDRIELEVLERIVHPSHVPLERESETTFAHRTRHAWPRRRLLGDRDRARTFILDRRIELLQERDRLEILSAAVLVAHPL